MEIPDLQRSDGVFSTDNHRLPQARGLPLTVTAQDPEDQGHLLHKALIDNPHAQTIRNEGVRALADQPPLTHHIHRAQWKLFGHVLRATPSNLERNCVFTKAFVYRGGIVKAGITPGQ